MKKLRKMYPFMFGEEEVSYLPLVIGTRGAIFPPKVITGTVPAPAKYSFYRHITAVLATITGTLPALTQTII